VKRAAFGAEGPVLDHYSAAATRQHLRSVGDPLLDAVPRASSGRCSATASRSTRATGLLTC
jgi:hypothetical protein